MMKYSNMLKNKIVLFIAVIGSLCGLYAFNSASESTITERGFTGNCDSIPELNKKILEYASGKMNLKVGVGESWDFVSDVLDAVGAKWDHEYKFGRKINPNKECIQPGDIIEMHNTKIEYKEHDVFYREELPLHIAIIYSVVHQDHFVLIEQNTGKLGQKVGTSPLELKQMNTGKFKIFRPIK